MSPPHILSRCPTMDTFVLWSGEKSRICFAFESRKLLYNKLPTNLACLSCTGEYCPRLPRPRANILQFPPPYLLPRLVKDKYLHSPDFLSVRYNSFPSPPSGNRDLNASNTLPNVISFKQKKNLCETYELSVKQREKKDGVRGMFSRIDRRTKELKWISFKQNCHEKREGGVCGGEEARGKRQGGRGGERGGGRWVKSEEGRQHAQHYSQLRGRLKRNWYWRKVSAGLTSCTGTVSLVFSGSFSSSSLLSWSGSITQSF